MIADGGSALAGGHSEILQVVVMGCWSLFEDEDEVMTMASTRSQGHRRDPVPVAVGDG